jgi:hypothetical protein
VDISNNEIGSISSFKLFTILSMSGSWHLLMDHLVDSVYYYKESHDVLLLTSSCGGNILGS